MTVTVSFAAAFTALDYTFAAYANAAVAKVITTEYSLLAALTNFNL